MQQGRRFNFATSFFFLVSLFSACDTAADVDSNAEYGTELSIGTDVSFLPLHSVSFICLKMKTILPCYYSSEYMLLLYLSVWFN